MVGITISDEQVAYAKSHVAGPQVEIRKQDYRDLKGEKFNKIVSIGMMEHVGYKNYRAFLEEAHSCLEDDGLFLLHTIGSNETVYTGEQWSDTYIFPNGMLPSIKQLGEASEGLFVMEDWHNFGQYYHQTLLLWDSNFQKNWHRVEHQYSQTFYRMFRYYFNSFAGSFKSRHIQLWQVMFSKGKTDDLYESIR